MADHTKEQAAPLFGRPGQIEVWPKVIADMKARDALGRERYGTPLLVHNGRAPLVDAYQEALDKVVYLKQAILEEEARKEELRLALCDVDVVLGCLRRGEIDAAWERLLDLDDRIRRALGQLPPEGR